MMAGQVLAGRYELGERLGVGGMSTVVRAFDARLERDVAVKLLAEHLADDSQFVARFRREALSVARLVHPNIVQVFDFGLDEATHRQYIVMELVRGQSGAEILRDEGSLDVRDALSIVVQALRGLEYAHRNGVVHRDVKPGNLLRGEDGVVKLADFGIAKAFSDESSITQVGSVLGTAAYLAPEQAAGEQAGPAADLYALGVVAYQFLVRAPALRGAVAHRAGAQAAARAAPAPGRAQPRGLAPARARRRPRARAGPAPAARQRRRAAPALADGARGVGPDPSRDPRGRPVDERHQRRPGSATARPPAWRARRSSSASRARPARPRPAPTAATIAPAAARPRRRGGARRFFGVVLVLLLLAAGGAAAVVATSNSDQAVHLRRVVYDDVNQGVDAVKQLVSDNTSSYRDARARTSTGSASRSAGPTWMRGPRPKRSTTAPRLAQRLASAASVPAPIASRSRRTTRSTKARLCSVNRRMPVSSRAWAR